MLKNSLLVSTLAVVGSLAIVPQVMAQTVNVPFSGNVSSVCTVTTPITPGVLGEGPGILDTGTAPGTPGSFNLDCTAPAQLQIDSVTFVSGPTPDPFGTFLGASAINSFDGSFANFDTVSGSISLATLGADPNNTISVDMIVDRNAVGGTFFGGTYDYEVQLTVVP